MHSCILRGSGENSRKREDVGRIEMQLVSQCEQTVNVGGKSFEFSKGEHIRTEYSHKYKIEDFTALAAEAGFTLRKSWSDPNQYFAVMYFVKDSA